MTTVLLHDSDGSNTAEVEHVGWLRFIERGAIDRVDFAHTLVATGYTTEEALDAANVNNPHPWRRVWAEVR